MIKPIRSRQQVEDFMRLPEIYRYAAPPGAKEPDKFTSDNPQEFWLGFYVDDCLAGVYSVDVKTGSMAEFHQYVKKQHKDLYGKMGADFFRWMDKNMPGELLKINATVPVIYEQTISIAKACGMTVEGIDTLSYRHKDGVCDRALLGIKRVDIK